VLSDDNSVADLIIEDPVEDGMASLGNSGPYGRAEDGKLYKYIVKDSVEGLPFAAAKIASIDLAANTHSVQQNGNVVQAFSTYTTLDGRTLEVADVGIQMNPRCLPLT
jgi:hypothetical protein